jgi:uncharacterized protein YfaS (alpha-2-macroglobulin family)
MFLRFLFLSVFFGCVFLGSVKVEAAEVLDFHPTGSVKNVQQVVSRFSTDMFAMGDARVKTQPFKIQCNTVFAEPDESSDVNAFNTPRYTTRWTDTKTWVLEFDEPLPAGVRCVFKPNPRAKDLASSAVVGFDEYVFSTSGPMVLGVAPLYRNIDPDQYFVVLMDGVVDVSSVEKYAYFEVENAAQAVGVNVVKGQAREDVIRAAVEERWDWDTYRNLLKRHADKPFGSIKEMGRFVVLRAVTPFPEEAGVVLHWPEGILSLTGVPVEQAQSFDFKVISPFKADFFCERTPAQGLCNPVVEMGLNFNQELPLSVLQGTKMVSTDGRVWFPRELENLPKGAQDPVSSLTFQAPFPEKSELKLFLPSGLKDPLGRILSNENMYPLTVSTDVFQPLIKFAAPFGILEASVEAALPVSVRNIEKNMSVRQWGIQAHDVDLSSSLDLEEMIHWYRAVERKEYAEEERNVPLLNNNEGVVFQMPKPLEEKAFEVVGIPLKKPGFYVVEIASARLGLALTETEPMYVASSALVTHMAVHFKKGIESSLVWVTRLSDAAPVGGAEVVITNASGKSLVRGTTDAQGMMRMGVIDNPCDAENNLEEEVDCTLFVFAKKGDDVSFVSSAWSNGIEPYRFNVLTDSMSFQWKSSVMHTVFDRMVAQPGETVQMKHILRSHHQTGFSMMDPKQLPKRVYVVHEGSGKTYTLPFVLDPSTGSALGSFAIPQDASLGRYGVYLSQKEEAEEESAQRDWGSQQTGYFMVNAYRLPLMKAVLKIQKEHVVRPSEVKADVSAYYLSGGPAQGLQMVSRAALHDGYFHPSVPDGEEYQFLGDSVQATRVENNQKPALEESFFKVQHVVLDADGGALATVSGLPNITRVKNLVLEMEYTDPNGEIRTTSSSVVLYPSDVMVGLRSDSWYVASDKTKIHGVVVNKEGVPQRDTFFEVEAFHTQYYTHRKRLVGGFYAYDSTSQVVSLGVVCKGESDAKGYFTCEPKKLPAGQVLFQAHTKDTQGRLAYTSLEVSVAQAGVDSWWVPGDSDRIDVLPEKKHYEPSDTASLVVRSPFMASTVLVTVEREGVLDAFVQRITRDNPLIKVPMKGHYAPDVFVSVLAVRGRVGEPKPTGLLDLGKPSMKMGMAQLEVGWTSHALDVSVKTNKKTYQVRDTVDVVVKVKPASGVKLPEHAEAAVVLVDEALLQLQNNTSWDLLKHMMGQRGLAVVTSSGQNQVIGRRHFGLKAKAAGGGGGSDGAGGYDPQVRDAFEPVLAWKPRVKLDASGEAKISLKLNDALSQFKVVAVVTAGDQFFGYGSTEVSSSKDLMVYSGFVPLAREGDRVNNVVTVRNTTLKDMKVVLEVSCKEASFSHKTQPFVLAPSASKKIDIPLRVPKGLKELSFLLQATDTLLGSQDKMLAHMRVEPAVPARVMQATLFQMGQAASIPVKQPSDALFGEGGVSVHLQKTLGSGLKGVVSYMEAYPYTCLEQKLSRAVVLNRVSDIQTLVQSLPSYMDESGLLKFFPLSVCGSAQLTRYVMDMLHAHGYVLPQNTQTRVLEGLVSYVTGKYTCYTWYDAIMDPWVGESKITLMETLSHYDAFDPKMLSVVRIVPDVWSNETLIAWIHLLENEEDIPGRDVHLNKAKKILRSRVRFQGSSLELQKGLAQTHGWVLLSSPDQEAIRFLGLAIEDASWGLDVGRVAKGVVSRLRFGHWDTTMANAWGVTYFERFSDVFESEKIEGHTKAFTNHTQVVWDWKSLPEGGKKFLTWPEGSDKKQVMLKIEHQGSGKPWVYLETLSAVPLKKPLHMGYRVSHRISKVVQKVPGRWHVGDVAHVEITVTAVADQMWVVVRDPVPSGASHLGTGLEGTSALLDVSPQISVSSQEMQQWPVEYEEKSHSSWTSYAAYVPKGQYRMGYRIRLNAAGEFVLPPTRVESMYAPEVFAETPRERWKVEP